MEVTENTGSTPTSGRGLLSPELHDCHITVDGTRMRYLRSAPRAADCPRLLLIHGLLGYSFSWRFNLHELARHSQVFAVDLPGTGFSERPTHMDRSLRGMAGYVRRFMDAAGIEKADVLGTSHGGAVALMLAATAPGRVRRLVLAAPANPWSRHGYWLTRTLGTTVGGFLFRCAAPCMTSLNRFLLQRLYGDPQRIQAGTLEGYSEALRLPGSLPHLLGIVRTWNEDLRQLKTEITSIRDIPALLIWGGRDRAVWPSSSADLKQRFSTAEMVILEGVGHMPYEEAPEEFNRAVTRFLYDSLQQHAPAEQDGQP